MGLDIYAGPLCRYYAGAWKTVIQQWGEAQGVPVRVVRPQSGSWTERLKSVLGIAHTSEDPTTMVQRSLSKVLKWREKLASQGRFAGDRDWKWTEGVEVEVKTDKPDFTGYGAVVTWAAYVDHPDLSRPVEISREWHEDPAVKFALGAPHATKFPHLYEPELWLPIAFQDVFEAEELTGNRCKIGSGIRLFDHLQDLNRRTWGADDAAVRSWKKEDFDPENLESVARWGYSIWYDLAEYSATSRVPMRLDY